MQSAIEKLKTPLMAMAMFVGGMGAAQFMQPANAQSAGGAISAASDNSAWVITGGKVYHCVHVSTYDNCHST